MAGSTKLCTYLAPAVISTLKRCAALHGCSIGSYIGRAIERFASDAKEGEHLLQGFYVGIQRSRRWYNRTEYKKICTSISAEQADLLDEIVSESEAPKTYVVERAIERYMQQDEHAGRVQRKIIQFLNPRISRPPQLSFEQLFGDELLAN